MLWITDLHIDSPSPALVAKLQGEGLERLLLTGDISDSGHFPPLLRQLASELAIPIYFVLGNHDIYGRSIAEAKAEAVELSLESENLYYLEGHAPIVLGDGAVLIGCDGWYDAREGNYEESSILLRDVKEISDFAGNKEERRELYQMLAEEAAQFAQSALERVGEFSTIYFATHTPPFLAACRYAEQEANEMWAPYFVCARLGDVLRQYAEEHPQQKLLVFCGHSHEEAVAKILPNLHVYAGAPYAAEDEHHHYWIGPNGPSRTRGGRG